MGQKSKTFVYKDLLGRGGSSSNLTEDHIRDTWNMEDTDENDVRLEDFLTDCSVGDEWSNSEDSGKLICASV